MCVFRVVGSFLSQKHHNRIVRTNSRAKKELYDVDHSETSLSVVYGNVRTHADDATGCQLEECVLQPTRVRFPPIVLPTDRFFTPF